VPFLGSSIVLQLHNWPSKFRKSTVLDSAKLFGQICFFYFYLALSIFSLRVHLKERAVALYGLFVLKTLLTMCKNHNLPSYVAFVDLVKAYDMANHELLLTLLEKYGAPPRFISAVEKMHQNLVVVLKIEKEVQEL
jgi:hypothetical protein